MSIMKLKPAAKARRTLIEISQEIKLEGYMMPDGSYRLNPTSLFLSDLKTQKSIVGIFGG
jgi:hypothetical protein